jgi:lysophospholipase L1-like esterase
MDASVIPTNDDSSDELIVIAFGDSTTAPRPDVVTYSVLLQSYFANHGVAAKVLNQGVPGDNTAHAIKRFDKDVLKQNPHLVIIQFGLNDAAVDVWRRPPARRTRVSLLMFKQNLRLMIRSLRKANSDVVLMTPNPLCWTDYMRKRYGHYPYDTLDEDGFNVVLKDFVEAVRELASEEDVGLLDVYAAFKAQNFGLATDDLLSDGMHPNSNGHALVANLLIDHLSERGRFFGMLWPGVSDVQSTSGPPYRLEVASGVLYDKH